MNTLEMETGSFQITLQPGDNWLHDHPLFGPFTFENPPTFALWITDEFDTYVDTIYVSKKIGQVAWISNDDPRPEALPLWSFKRGGQPTEESPVPDGITGATPKDSSMYQVSPGSGLSKFTLWLELNHSLDYNSYYLEGINDENAENYSGGIGGSGQPSLVYRADIDLNTDSGMLINFVLAGHGEPGGESTGTVYADTSSVSSAKEILERAEVKIQ